MAPRRVLMMRVLILLALLAPAAVVATSSRATPSRAASSRAASSREDAARRDLHDAERLSHAQRAAHEKAADRAARVAAEAQLLAQQRVAAAAGLRLAETATADVAARIDALAQRRRAAEQRLQARARAMRPLLPLIERLSLYPAETLLAVPAPPDVALRGVLVLQGLSRQMEIEAEALRRDQAEADAATEALRQDTPRLAQAEAAQQREADALDRQIAAAHAEQAAAEAQADQAASQAAAAAGRMGTLRTALTALEAQRRVDVAKAAEQAARAERKHRTAEAQAAQLRQAAASRPTGSGTIAADDSPHGQLQPPVIGVVVTGWGEPTDGGPATGVSYHAPPGAHVVAPCGGRVVFAASFRSYGLLLIIDCGGGYHVVMSGFDRLDVKLGQRLVAAEPVGVMPRWEPGSQAHRPSLYVELRHDGAPVNPAPWLRSSS